MSVRVSGDIEASVIAIEGAISEVSANGVILSPTDPTNRVQIRSPDGVRVVSATAIAADIIADYNGGSGILSKVQTTAGDFTGTVSAAEILGQVGTDGIRVVGDFNGALSTRYISGHAGTAIHVQGDLNADLTFDEFTNRPITVEGMVTPTSTITIGGELLVTSPLTINTAGGLQGQIIINAANGTTPINPPQTSFWQGEVNVGPVGNRIVINESGTPPMASDFDGLYTATSDDLGGGAIGLVPFAMHALDCDPPYTGGDGHEFVGTQWDDAAPYVAGQNAIFIRHYGPITGVPPYVTISLATTQGEMELTDHFKVETSAEDSSLDDRTIASGTRQ